jgi:hypothetical protein
MVIGKQWCWHNPKWRSPVVLSPGNEEAKRVGLLCWSIFPEISRPGTPVVVNPSEVECRLVGERCVVASAESDMYCIELHHVQVGTDSCFLEKGKNSNSINHWNKQHVNFWLSHIFTLTMWGFSEPQILTLCSWTLPATWNIASSENIIKPFFMKTTSWAWQLCIFSTKCWRFMLSWSYNCCTSWTLYALNLKLLCSKYTRGTSNTQKVVCMDFVQPNVTDFQFTTYHRWHLAEHFLDDYVHSRVLRIFVACVWLF